MSETKRIIYTGSGPTFSVTVKGRLYTFSNGTVYTVSENMFQYLRAFRGFHEVKEIKIGKIDFDNIKKVNE